MPRPKCKFARCTGWLSLLLDLTLIDCSIRAVPSVNDGLTQYRNKLDLEMCQSINIIQGLQVGNQLTIIILSSKVKLTRKEN